MAKENETIADIIAEKRRRADEIERDCAEKMKRGEMISDRYARELVADIRREADRLEAACKRKLSDFNPRCDWSVQESLDFANALANHGWTREANSDAASSCIYSLCRLLKERGNAAHKREAAFHAMTCEANERLREHLQIALDANKRERGDCAKLREALDRLAIASEGFLRTHSGQSYADTMEALDKARAALAAPPRNCDKNPTFNDAIRALADKRGWHDAKWDSERYCILASWLYAPYEEGGNK